MIVDMLNNRTLNKTETELFWVRKLNISLVFITTSYFAFPKNIMLNSTHHFENSKQARASTNRI